MVDAIEAVDWDSLPGPPDYYRPAAVREGLRSLACAQGRLEAASAASGLAGGGIIHDHSGTVFPSAVSAAPLLLQIAQASDSAVQEAVLELIEDALNFRPFPGFFRTQNEVRLCCAITAHIHAHRFALARLGNRSRSLISTAQEHWRIDIQETCDDGADLLVLGTVTGTAAGTPQAVELHTDGGIALLSTMTVEYPTVGEHAQICVRIADPKLPEFHSKAALNKASCGE